VPEAALCRVGEDGTSNTSSVSIFFLIYFAVPSAVLSRCYLYLLEYSARSFQNAMENYGIHRPNICYLTK